MAGQPEVVHYQAMLGLGIDGANMYFDDAQGRAPRTTSEIALSLLALNQAGRDVGQCFRCRSAGSAGR